MHKGGWFRVVVLFAFWDGQWVSKQMLERLAKKGKWFNPQITGVHDWVNRHLGFAGSEPLFPPNFLDLSSC